MHPGLRISLGFDSSTPPPPPRGITICGLGSTVISATSDHFCWITVDSSSALSFFVTHSSNSAGTWSSNSAGVTSPPLFAFPTNIPSPPSLQSTKVRHVHSLQPTEHLLPLWFWSIVPEVSFSHNSYAVLRGLGTKPPSCRTGAFWAVGVGDSFVNASLLN